MSGNLHKARDDRRESPEAQELNQTISTTISQNRLLRPTPLSPSENEQIDSEWSVQHERVLTGVQLNVRGIIIIQRIAGSN